MLKLRWPKALNTLVLKDGKDSPAMLFSQKFFFNILIHLVLFPNRLSRLERSILENLIQSNTAGFPTFALARRSLGEGGHRTPKL
ncbi:MAG: hypothetical protein ABL876_05760 [Chitinophagaceae bacterium]